MANNVTELWNADIFVARSTMTKERAIELIAEFERAHGREPFRFTMIPAYVGEEILRNAVKRGECEYLDPPVMGRPKLMRPGMRGIKVNQILSLDLTSIELIGEMSKNRSKSSVVEDALELLRDEKASGMTHEEVRALIQSHSAITGRADMPPADD